MVECTGSARTRFVTISAAQFVCKRKSSFYRTKSQAKLSINYAVYEDNVLMLCLNIITCSAYHR